MTTGRIRLAAAASAIALCIAMPLTADAEPQSLIAGTVVDFHGKYGLVVRDVHGALAEVTLHQGTIIKPVGLRLERGMKVIIIGRAAELSFAAVEIDAPLEVWPTARAVAMARTQRQRMDTMPLSPTRDNANTRWQEGPDHVTAPPDAREPAPPINPH